jgi:cell division protein FtsQ
MIFGIGLLVLISVGWHWWQKICFVPIKVVTSKDKLQYVAPELIKAAVTEEVQRGFFGLRVAEVRDKLLQVPWVSAAQVQRKWPHTLELKIIERQPLAIWDNRGVIDTEGNLFFPPTLDNVHDVAEFSGDQSHVDAMIDTYLLILAKIKPIGLAVKRLTIMPDHGWHAMLDNGVSIILGQTELEERLARFVLAYNDPKARIRNDRTQIIDLRYTNGIAVGEYNGK